MENNQQLLDIPDEQIQIEPEQTFAERRPYVYNASLFVIAFMFSYFIIAMVSITKSLIMGGPQPQVNSMTFFSAAFLALLSVKLFA